MAEMTTAAQSVKRKADSLSPLALGMLSLSLMLIYFWLSGTLSLEESAGFWMEPIRAIGIALALSTTIAFLFAASRYAKRQTHVTLDQLIESGTLSRETTAPLRMKVFSLSSSQNIAVSILGVVFGCFNIPWNPIVNDLGQPTMFASLSIVIGNLAVWLVVVHVLVRNILNSNSLGQLGRQHAKVDLLRPDSLLLFGRIGTLSLAIVTITLTFTVFQSLDAELRWVNYRNAFAVGLPAAVVLLLLPMLGIRQNVRAAKKRALEKLNAAIAAADRELKADSLHYLCDLLRQRESIERTREWPLDTTAFSRVAIYVVIPPLAWVGGAFAEILIEMAMTR